MSSGKGGVEDHLAGEKRTSKEITKAETRESLVRTWRDEG
jgi:hypothetical protein